MATDNKQGRNGIGVCNWDEWNSLSEEAQKRELYRVLIALDMRTRDITPAIKRYAFGGGVVGGMIAFLTLYGAILSGAL